MKIVITQGLAIMAPEGLRCQGQRPRSDDPSLVCNRLLAKVTGNGQLAGSFMCPRCKQIIEVRTA